MSASHPGSAWHGTAIYATVDAVPLLLPQPGRGVRTRTRVTADTPQSMRGTDTCHCPLLTLRTLCYCGVTWPILTDTYFRATLKLKTSLIWYFSSSLNSYCGRAFCGALRVLHRTGSAWSGCSRSFRSWGTEVRGAWARLGVCFHSRHQHPVWYEQRTWSVGCLWGGLCQLENNGKNRSGFTGKHCSEG